MRDLVKGRYYVTPQGAERLRAELIELQDKRGEMAENIRTAKSYGDLSENFEYHEARREAGMVDGRILQLKEILSNLEVIDPEETASDEVDFGSVVRLRDDTGDEFEVTIVGSLEADPLNDLISFESPLGSALLGTRAGQKVQAEAPDGAIEYQVLEVHPYRG